MIVHTRDARADTLAILREEKVTDCGGVLHCFTEDRETAGKLLDMGFYISFSGIVTFVTPSSCVMRRATCRWIACWLKPIRRTGAGPHRGKENQPALVRDVAEYMAVLKGCRLSSWLSRPPTILPPCSTSTPPVCNLLDLLIILRLVINSQSE